MMMDLFILALLLFSDAGPAQGKTPFSSEALDSSLIMNHYWYGFWGEELPLLVDTVLKARVSDARWATVVCIDALQTVLAFQRHDPYSGVVIRAPRAASSDDVNARTYQSVADRDCRDGKETAIFLQAEELQFGGDVFTLEEVEFVEGVMGEVVSDEWREFMENQLAQVSRETREYEIRVGNPLDGSMQWIFHYIRGIPYLGIAHVNRETGEIFWEDSLYVHETPQAQKYRHAIERIEENARCMTVRDGQLSALLRCR